MLDEDRLHELVGVEELTSSVSMKALHAYPDRCGKFDEAVERLRGVVLLAEEVASPEPREMNGP